MARSRRTHRAARSTRKARIRKPKDIKVKHGGHTHRTVNAPKTW